MLLLSIENATAQGSVAVLRDGRVVAERAWIDLKTRAARLFPELQQLLSQVGIEAAAFEWIVVGLGPGGFASLRMAVSAARGLALPGGMAVYGVSSAAAVAAEGMALTGLRRAAVIGDARRGRVWAGFFAERDGAVDRLAEFELLADPAALAARLAAHDIEAVASPDAPALAPVWQVAARRWLPAALVPTATGVARVALARLARGLPSESLAPIYLHPAVTIPPRFPAG